MRYLDTKILFIGLFAGMVLTNSCSQKQVTKTREVWPKEKANEWGKQHGWLRGCNFIPSTAVNQLEMWQAETFDTATINRELGWAEWLGMNTMRVFLHHAAWQIDTAGFKNRIGQYLAIANKHGIGTIFVFFDDCWGGAYHTGKQPDPKPGYHNTAWVGDPGDAIFSDSALLPILEKYVKDIMISFASDKRVIMWDLYNEVGDNSKGEKSWPLLKKIYNWGHEVNPSQPITAGLWYYAVPAMNKYLAENADIITYHNYQNDTLQRKFIDSMSIFGRPLICTEYMARTLGSRFDNIMPLLKEKNVGAINWGLVAGKTNTIYGWDESIPDGSEPKLWFHDIFRKDGTPYKKEEADLIRSLTGKIK